jgi:predicted nuclease with TOPRIM domain
MDDIVDSAVWFRDLARVTADEIARLQAENTQVRRELDKADRTNEALRAENERLTAERDELCHDVERHLETIGRLREALREIDDGHPDRDLWTAERIAHDALNQEADHE